MYSSCCRSSNSGSVQKSLLLQLRIHKKVSPTCASDSGRCHYYESCGFSANSVQDMRKHLQENVDVHLEYLTMKCADIETESRKNQDKVLRSDSTACMVMLAVKYTRLITVKFNFYLSRCCYVTRHWRLY